MTKDVGDLVGWSVCQYKDLLEYLQPTKYIVESTKYNDNYKTPVLTAGKSFIKGYTNELEGVFENLPTIIFDDFTTASRYVNFPFKVKSSAMKILVPSCKLVNLKFVFYCMQNDIIRSDTHKRYWISVYSIKELGLPPLAEQNRIVAKIEQLFSELDKGIESLKKTSEQLTVYRKAVLKHAFEGKLTEKWREQNKDKLETAGQLLTRIQNECEVCYQQQLEEWHKNVKKWEENDKAGKKPIKPRRQKETVPPSEEDLNGLLKLPNTWKWVRLGQIVWSVKDGPHYSPKYTESGIPFISGGNIRPDGVDFDGAKYISPELHDELSVRCKPHKGDILYTKGGTTGIARVNTYDMEFNVWVHVAVLKITESLQPFYIQHALNAPECYSQSQKYTHGVGNQDLGLTRMVNIIFPLCCEAEQTEIIKILDQITSELNATEKVVEQQLFRAENLRQSILKKAFSGQLVVQNPSDESAAVLLERIKTEKEKQKIIVPKKKKTKKRKASV